VCQARPVTILLCTDGSPLALDALTRGLRVIRPTERFVVAIVVELTHAVDVHGTGMAGGVISPQAAAEVDEGRIAAAEGVLADTVASLDLAAAEAVETTVLDGAPGPALCELAESLGADAIVLGSRGISGFRRAVLGSVSDHVVRNAPCPVVVTND